MGRGPGVHRTVPNMTSRIGAAVGFVALAGAAALIAASTTEGPWEQLWSEPPTITGGTPVLILEGSSGDECTLGPVIDEHTALIAAHCVQPGSTITDAATHSDIGTADIVIPTADIATITLNPPTGTTITPNPTSVNLPPVGTPVQKTGSTTGTTTGIVTSDPQPFTALDSDVDEPIMTVETSLCARPGDSGASVLTTDGTTWATLTGTDPNMTPTCNEAEQRSYVVPLSISIPALQQAGAQI